MSAAVWVVLAACILKVCASAFLEYLNLRELKKHSAGVPEAFSSFVDSETFSKSLRYTEAKTKFGVAEDLFSFAFVAALLVCGAFPYLFGKFIHLFGTGVWGQAFTLMAILVLLSVPSLPFEFFEQFSIEQKFGFNKSSVGLWIADKAKESLLSVLLFVPMVALVLFFTEKFEDTWWILGFAANTVFLVVMMVVYPIFIVPLFNKLQDLPDGELKTALFDLANRGKFRAKTIQVIDGSRRSSHSNAYFTGFGKFRRIVLFDTLIDQLDRRELEAVLAHEIGHYRKGHILKMLATSFTMTFFAFALIGWIAASDWFYTQFGFDKSWGVGSVLLMFSLFSGAFTFWFTPLSNMLSRRHEYEADAFSAELCGGGEPLISALKKLHTKNLGNLTPHPLYSAFHYSHPTLLERINHVR